MCNICRERKRAKRLRTVSKLGLCGLIGIAAAIVDSNITTGIVAVCITGAALIACFLLDSSMRSGGDYLDGSC